MAQYIDKNKVLMWIMEELNSYQPTEITSGKYALTSAVDFINTLETKDIDKVNKIYEKIEKRYEYWREKEHNSHSIETEARMSECQHLLLLLSHI